MTEQREFLSIVIGLETPLRKARGLAYAVQRFASSGELNNEGENALYSLADCLIDDLDTIFSEWEAAVEAGQKKDGGAA